MTVPKSKVHVLLALMKLLDLIDTLASAALKITNAYRMVFSSLCMFWAGVSFLLSRLLRASIIYYKLLGVLGFWATDSDYANIEAVGPLRIFPQLDRQPRDLPRLVPAVAERRPHGVSRSEFSAEWQARRAAARQSASRMCRVLPDRNSSPRTPAPWHIRYATGQLQRDQQFLYRYHLQQGRGSGAHVPDPAGS